MVEMTVLGSFLPFFFFLTFNPKVSKADLLRLSVMWGSISVAVMFVNWARVMDEVALSRFLWYSLKQVPSLISYWIASLYDHST